MLYDAWSRPLPKQPLICYQSVDKIAAEAKSFADEGRPYAVERLFDFWRNKMPDCSEQDYIFWQKTLVTAYKKGICNAASAALSAASHTQAQSFLREAFEYIGVLALDADEYDALDVKNTLDAVIEKMT